MAGDIKLVIYRKIAVQFSIRPKTILELSAILPEAMPWYTSCLQIGVSSCGVFEMADWFDEKAPSKRYAFTAIPRFLNIARTSDFVGMIAPRPFLMTRGLWEWGQDNPKNKASSIDHVKSTEKLYNEAFSYYKKLESGENLKAIYFDEGGGRHAFPPKVKKQVYAWIASYLK
jgi:hypothetical protein